MCWRIARLIDGSEGQERPKCQLPGDFRNIGEGRDSEREENKRDRYIMFLTSVNRSLNIIHELQETGMSLQVKQFEPLP